MLQPLQLHVQTAAVELNVYAVKNLIITMPLHLYVKLGLVDSLQTNLSIKLCFYILAIFYVLNSF